MPAYTVGIFFANSLHTQESKPRFFKLFKMANQLSILSSFTHITSEIEGINALVSVQYPELSSLQSLGDSFLKVFGNKRAVYLATTSQSLIHIQTVGERIVKQEIISVSDIDEIKIFNTTLTSQSI